MKYSSHRENKIARRLKLGMSGENASFTDTVIHDKLEPPKSLHGVEDAEIIWETITQRFPNAAPLLCEMETVIERAEDLLQQLKTSSAQGNDTSSSFHTPDSRESNATISMVSDIESFAEETNTSDYREITENPETQVTAHEICGKQADLESQCCSEQSVQGDKKHFRRVCHSNSPSRAGGIGQHFEISTSPREKSDTNVTDNTGQTIGVSSEKRLAQAIAETNSLEEWMNVADVLQEWQDDIEDDDDSDVQANMDRNMDNLSLIVNVDDKINKQASIETRSTETANSPLTILEEYAKRCKVPIRYEYKPKPNLYVINGDLCGFRAKSCAATQDLAKNKLAAKILWIIAERQMDGTKFPLTGCELLDFTRKEMLEIMAFNEDELKNASQKVYKLCLVEEESIPEYTVRTSKTNQGFMYEAECVALGYVGTGQGWRKDSAKIAAAENLYQKYASKTIN